MARPRSKDEAQIEAEVDEREGEAEAVSEQVEEAEKAEKKRDAEKERASALKSVPDDSEAPTERMIGGEKAYSVERLINESSDFFDGIASHEMAGALYGSTDEYITVKDAQKRVEDFKAREV